MPMPLGDDNPDHGVPVINYLIFLLCFGVFAYEVPMYDSQLQHFVDTWGFSAYDYVNGLSGMKRLVAGLASVFDFRGATAWRGITMIFIHGGALHVIGNMLFLWIFGDNVEHVMGKWRFAVFFLLTGMLANLAQSVIGPDSPMRCIGASGAVSGVMGAYLVYYPRAYVRLLWYPPWRIFAILPSDLHVRAWIYLLFCFAGDIFTGIVTWGDRFYEVAVWAHVGGFLAGMLLAWPFKDPEMVFMDDMQNRMMNRVRRRRCGGWNAMDYRNGGKRDGENPDDEGGTV